MRFYLIRFFLLLLISLPISAQNFEDYFENKSLRIDFLLLGSQKETQAVVQSYRKEKFWAGSTKNLIFPDKGSYRIQVFDASSEQLIFSKGFNSLLEEWSHTPVAKSGNTQSFYHTQQIPFPKKSILWQLQKRQSNGKFITILEQTLSPKNKFIIEETPRPYKVKKLVENGNPYEKLDIAIIAEGYTEQQQEKFFSDAQRMIDYLFKTAPFDKLKSHFNIYAIASISMEEGTDEPSYHWYRNTVVNSSFDTFDIPRYLTTTDQKSVADIAALVPYDQMYVLVNTQTYGGGAFYNHLNLTAAHHPASELIFVHELGHGLVGLADEYYDSSTSFNDLYDLNVEPWEENITTLVDFEKKWKLMVPPSTPIPTPRTADFQNSVGVFEGGGYVTKGIYSPMQNCLMKTLQHTNFCPVCQKSIEKTILFYSE